MLRYEAMLHVDALALLVHPALAGLRVAVEVWGVFFARKSRAERAFVRPELVAATHDEHRDYKIGDLLTLCDCTSPCGGRAS